MTQITVENITPNTYTEDFIVDCARVSFAKRADQFTPEQNAKLIRYLALPPQGVPHWTPFAGVRFEMTGAFDEFMWMRFLTLANTSGFVWKPEVHPMERTLNGSLWAWANNLNHLPAGWRKAVTDKIRREFPVTYDVLALGPLPYATFDPEPYTTHHFQFFNLRIKAPIFVARQLAKHQVGLAWSEVSRRYVKTEPDLWVPETYHRAPEGSIKQGCSEESFPAPTETEELAKKSVQAYVENIQAGMAPEEARMFLPQNMLTEWIWTGSRAMFERVLRERLGPSAQLTGTREVALKIQAAITGVTT